MNVGELKAALADLPDDAIVVVSGYEDGMTAATTPVAVRAVERKSGPWYYGEWQKSSASDAATVVYLPGLRHDH